MSTLVFDTETTGLPNFRLPAADPSQPHIAQLGAILFDDADKVVAEINLLVAPEGWEFSSEAVAVHGITFEQAARFGLRLAGVMNQFHRLAEMADILVAHQYAFDNKMVRREFCHLGLDGFAEGYRTKPSFCTMLASAPIVNLPPTEKMLRAGFNKPKSPTMQEAYMHFNEGRTFDGSHDAMADVRACADVYFKLRNQNTSPAVVETE